MWEGRWGIFLLPLCSVLPPMVMLFRVWPLGCIVTCSELNRLYCFFSQLLNQDIQCKPGEVSLCLKRAKHGQSEGEGRKQGKQIETRIFQVKIYGLLRLFVCHFLWL